MMWSVFASAALLAGVYFLTTQYTKKSATTSTFDGIDDDREFEANKDPTRKLIYAHVLYRHGDRAPGRLYPNDPYQMDIWPEGAKQLTRKGMLQQYLLGKYFRKRYSKLLGDRFSLSDIYVRSSDINRTLQSAAANLAGLYPPAEDQMFIPGINWQPIPIHTVPLAEDFVTKIKRGRCPVYDDMMKREQQITSDVYNKKYKEFFEKVRNHAGISQADFVSVSGLYSTLAFEHATGLKLPDWTQEVVDKKSGRTAYQLIVDMFTERKNHGYNSPEKAKLTAGYLLGEILDRLKKVSKGETGIKEIQATKFVMYSSHDGNVLAMLHALGLVRHPFIPPFAAAIMIDLYVSEDGQHHVEVTYKGNTPKARDCKGKKCRGAYDLNPTKLTIFTIPGCPSPRCPLDTFTRVLESKTSYPENKRRADCGLGDNAAAGPDGDSEDGNEEESED